MTNKENRKILFPKAGTWIFSQCGLLTLVFFLLFCSVVDVMAAGEEHQADNWRFDADIYLWAAGINGTSVSGGDIDIGFDTILPDLKMTFM